MKDKDFDVTVLPQHDMTIDYCHCGAMGDDGHTLGCVLEIIKRQRENTSVKKYPRLPHGNEA